MQILKKTSLLEELLLYSAESKSELIMNDVSQFMYG